MMDAVPEQCSSCRYLFYDEQKEARCKKNMQQHCKFEEGVQKLTVEQGHCSLLNPDGSCSEYKKKGFLRSLL